MKNMKLKTKKAIEAFKMLDSAKYQKLSDDDKVKIWKITRALRPIALEYSDEVQDARERLVPSDDYKEKLQKAQMYEQMKKEGKDNLPMSDEEYLEFLKVFKEYMELLDKALKEGLDKENDIDIPTISEDAFGKLMASNDWSFGQVEALDFIIE